MEPDKTADLTAIDGDLRVLEPDAIRGSRVSMTMIAGEVVFDEATR